MLQESWGVEELSWVSDVWLNTLLHNDTVDDADGGDDDDPWDGWLPFGK